MENATTLPKLIQFYRSLDTEELAIWRAKLLYILQPNPCSKFLIRRLLATRSYLLHLPCVTPLKSCEAERLFSAVRRRKTSITLTTGYDRLTSVALQNMDQSTRLCHYANAADVVAAFIRQRPRGLSLICYQKNNELFSVV